MAKISFVGYRFPPEIIQQAIWFYVRFTLSFRDVEDLLAERGIAVSYETVRRWTNHFGPKIAADLRERRPKPHTTWHLDEVYLKIDGRLVYLWRAVDGEGEGPLSSPWSRTGAIQRAIPARDRRPGRGVPLRLQHVRDACDLSGRRARAAR